MIDLNTGVLILDGIRISPDMGIEDFKNYTKEKVLVRDRGNGRGIICLKNRVVSNGISAGVEIWIDSLTDSFYVTILPDLTGHEDMDLLSASKQWIYGMIPRSLFDNVSENSLFVTFPWGSIVAQYIPDRDYGTVGGGLTIYYNRRKHTK